MREQGRLQRLLGISIVFLLLVLANSLEKSPNALFVHADTIKKAKINVNTCSKRELMKKIPGMTTHKAQKIIKGRPYVRLYDLVTKRALTKKELSRIRDLITVKDL